MQDILDLRSAGVVIYEAATLVRPFKGLTRFTVYESILKDEINFDLVPDGSDETDRDREIKAVKTALNL